MSLVRVVYALMFPVITLILIGVFVWTLSNPSSENYGSSVGVAFLGLASAFVSVMMRPGGAIDVR